MSTPEKPNIPRSIRFVVEEGPSTANATVVDGETGETILNLTSISVEATHGGVIVHCEFAWLAPGSVTMENVPVTYLARNLTLETLR